MVGQGMFDWMALVGDEMSMPLDYPTDGRLVATEAWSDKDVGECIIVFGGQLTSASYY